MKVGEEGLRRRSGVTLAGHADDIERKNIQGTMVEKHMRVAVTRHKTYLLRSPHMFFFVRNEQERQAIVMKKDGRTIRSSSEGRERKRMM
jgi:hypothetical protein